MLTDVIFRGVDRSQTLLRYARKHAARRLGRLGQHVHRVAVTLSDINGPRGGEDKRCDVVVDIYGQAPLVLHSVDHNPYACIDDALTRARRRLGDTGRQKTKTRRSRRLWAD